MITAAVIVLFNPNPEQILNNIKSLVSGVQKCFVVVNSCNGDILSQISDIQGVEIINNLYNIGLSKSLNLGIKAAIAENAEAIYLFDQDSSPSDSFFSTMYECYNNLLSRFVKLGAIGACTRDIKDTYSKEHESSLFTETNFVITSGTLIPVNCIEEVGLMDETFFIDYIDYEWCFRAQSKDFKIFISNKSLLHHNLGDNLVGFFNVKKPIHSNVMRHYHIIRNQLIILCRAYIPLQWRIIHFLKLFYRIPGYIIYSSDRKGTTKNIVKAFTDFFNVKDKGKVLY